MIRQSLENIRRVAESGGYNVAPVSVEIMADIRTPIEVLKMLKKISGHCFLLESVADSEKWGRYTFIGFDPKMEITCIDGMMKISGRELVTSRPAEQLREILAEHRSCRFEGMPPFTGGLVGYFSFDYLKYAEPSLRLDASDNEGFRDFDLMLFDKVIAFDNFRQKMILIGSVYLDAAAGLEAEFVRVNAELEGLAEFIETGRAGSGFGNESSDEDKNDGGDENGDGRGRMTSEITALFGEDEFCRMVERAKWHIREGDVFQIVLSNRLEAEFEGSLLNAYRVLRTINPSPYMFFFSGDDIEVAGASPETLIRLEDGVLYTFPLAGTRPRGSVPEEDLALEKELLADPKELAEHDMLVDLGRNDLGRVSRFGTVRVEKLHEVLRFSHVMHIGSTISGLIREDKDALDALESVLPAGTLSGAPKIKACQLINDLEGNKRGIYGGAIGYLDFSGNMDMCIAIRIAYKKNGKVFVRSGAGIVADSIPRKEYKECIDKASAVVSALKAAEKFDADRDVRGMDRRLEVKEK